MNFQEFRTKMFELECFNTNQVYAWKPYFEKNNLWEWTRKDLLVKLRNGYYTFPEFKSKSGFSFFLANRIYRPSYISLHTALAFLRLVYGIDRFSEDLDFDCKNVSHEEFIAMTDAILIYLQKSGFKVETRDKVNEKLKAFRRNLYFPEMLFEMGVSGYRDERFLIKVESQGQQIKVRN
ncbi:MAG: nucleotidyl transferase AbiEii/AbiGii toxin family protein [Bacteroidota bacterium]|nr:nucleotidyl transferase AbiEii/AbiGii toxin family protein [Bacteroidota bacterium]